ncbi:MAG TPA: CDP-alcohol phosphatidyltransferase family protein [Anaeromyxobacteraceae bacterium]|nr:CDP-alcohol phosphatidyltransferase family protein [Anaeromyxobacteraceae bacterium]
MGGLEPAEGREGPALNLANALTLSRFVLAPVFLVLYVRGEELRALAAFAAAAATDVLDGLVARALRQHTRLGAFLDPIADKFLFACALVALAAAGRLPVWLPVLVVARDLAQLLGAGLLRGTHHVVPVAPTRIGKYASAGLAATVVLAMAEGFGPMPPARVLAPYVAAAGLLAAECVALSFAQYVYFFARTLRAAPGR